MLRLDDYRPIVGDKVLSEIFKLANELAGLRVLHINSTYYGGGVAEILQTVVQLMNDVGIETDWRILRGTSDFFEITKKFHNGLQGEAINFTEIKKTLFEHANEDFARYCKIDHDVVIVHDPQPLPLIRYYRKRVPWIWRCHVDLSHPDPELWEYLKGFIMRYDAAVVSSELYKKEDLPIDQTVIAPAIDPLSPKNMELDESLFHERLAKFGIPCDKPLVTQISRFDKWKDPLGVIEVFKLVRSKVDCRLVLCGSMASDDPEGIEIFEQVKKSAKNETDNGDIILITKEDNVFVNALQRISAVIVQKSTREGFGLTVTEGLWKSRPVVASNIGGIPLQIRNNETGYLVDPADFNQCADKIVSILTSPEEANEMGKRAKEDVRTRFLITRYLLDDLRLIHSLQ